MPKCVICGSKTILIAHGLVAGWISEIVGHKFGRTALLSCTSCLFAFFSHRYTDDEISSIYSIYRSNYFYEVRHSWEPWYRKEVNEVYRTDSAELDERVSFMSEILKLAGCVQFDLVVDVGGDEGQFFPNVPSNRRIVIDTSNRTLRPGIERAVSLDNIDSQPDLIIAAHILEHVNDPVEFVKLLNKNLQQGGLIYFEVPMDVPRVSKHHAKTEYQIYLELLKRSPKLFYLLADILSGISKQFDFKIPRLGLVKQSEHINYFSEKSLTTLVSNLGFEVVNIKALPDAKVGGLRLGRMGLLAQKL